MFLLITPKKNFHKKITTFLMFSAASHHKFNCQVKNTFLYHIFFISLLHERNTIIRMSFSFPLITSLHNYQDVKGIQTKLLLAELQMEMSTFWSMHPLHFQGKHKPHD